ncbi:phosphopantetheine-binding protein [uncultured Peptoniphilus sp.]|uniref:phosphopantetheine-binding protein n=1 Tax=uncultured Peptoniphilus sp. TaxID=254354 RepID=UPI00280632C0|nr:phosphopantetheine-binding protein [uncultured Peptoniphilus sp.]
MKEKIKEIIEEVTGEQVEDATNLIGEGILDSFDIISLVLELEEAFSVKIEVGELEEDNFKDLLSIEKLINSLK